MDKLAHQAARLKPSLPKTPVVKTPRILPTNTTQRWVKLERTIQQHIKPASQLHIAPPSTSPQYEQVMQQFLQFKKEADVFLYYRARQTHATPLEPEEIRQWLERIYHTEALLNTLRGVIQAKDTPLEQAYTYLNEVIMAVIPGMRPFKAPLVQFKRTDRVYKQHEFFLHEPTAPRRFVKNIRRFLFGNSPRPGNLQIAIFNDSRFFINDFLQWYKRGTLFGQDRLVFFTNAKDLLNRIEQGYINPDVIITDILSADGVGGLFLTQELRSKQYNGVILGLSAYTEEDLNGAEFMSYGFDGILSNPLNDTTPELRQRMNQALDTYFYYRDLHKWKR